MAAPKSKYVEHILLATRSGEAGVAEVFRTLQHRLRDSTWTIAFKAHAVVHLMIRDGEKDATLGYLAAAPKTRLAINTITEGTIPDLDLYTCPSKDKSWCRDRD